MDGPAAGDASDDTTAVLRFNEAINARDLPALTRLMTDDHRFVDSAGDVVDGKDACIEAWRGFFAAFPDYRNTFESLDATEPGVVEVEGRSDCSVAELAGPARWRVVVRGPLVAEWRVVED
jgi:ketosteroid isomerase-like protein